MFSPLAYMGVPCVYTPLSAKDFISKSIHDATLVVKGTNIYTPKHWLNKVDQFNLGMDYNGYPVDRSGYLDLTGSTGFKPRYDAPEDTLYNVAPTPFKVWNNIVQRSSLPDGTHYLSLVPRSDSINPKPELEYFNHLDALPLAMYVRIYRDYFMNRELMMNYPNTYKLWYPTVDEDFRLPIDPKNIPVGVPSVVSDLFTSRPRFSEDGTNPSFALGTEEHNAVNCLNMEHPLLPDNVMPIILDDPYQAMEIDAYITNPHAYWKDCTINCSNDKQIPIFPILNRPYFADYNTDYFGKVSPFPDLMRHALPTMENTVNYDAYADFQKCFSKGTGSTISSSNYLGVRGSSNPTLMGRNISSDGTITEDDSGSISDLGITALNKNEIVGDFTVSQTINAFRNFKYANILADKLSRTKGTYNQNHRAFFGNDGGLHECTPTYIGGFFQDVIFSDTTVNSGEDVGQRVSNGVSINNGHITSNFMCPDYGYLMTILYIVPNTINEPLGIERNWLATTQDDVYLPEKNMLPSDVLYKYEMDIFQRDSYLPYAFAPKYEYLKHRINKALGLFGCGYSSYDSALLSTRIRSSVFNPWNNKIIPSTELEYSRNPTFDRNAFSDKINPLFDCQCAITCNIIAPMPYQAKPTKIGGLL